MIDEYATLVVPRAVEVGRGSPPISPEPADLCHVLSSTGRVSPAAEASESR
jgi:hypothetical protein